MQKTRLLSDKILLFVKGIAMGAANKVPGVSGGMVAYVGGFYEELIYSLQRVNRNAFKLLINGRFKSFYQYINGKFLLLVFAGTIFSYFSVSRLLDYFLRHYELYVWSLFFGMIIGSIYYILKDFHDWSWRNIFGMTLGAGIGIAISFMSPAKESDELFFVFICGIVSVSGMTLPGLSGSFILILMGNYVLLLVDSVNELYKVIVDVLSFDFSFVHDAVRIRYLKIITVFTLGSAAGLVLFSHIIGFLLKRWHNLVTSVIIGFIAGSLGLVWPWKEVIYKLSDNGEILYDSLGDKVVENYHRYLPDLTNYISWVAIGYIILGIAVLLWLEWYGERYNIKKQPKREAKIAQLSSDQKK